MGLAAGAALRRSPRPAAGRILAFVVAVAAVETSTFALLYPAIDPVKSPRPIAEAAAAVAPEQTALGVFRHGAFAGGLAYYSGRPVEILESASDVYDFAAAGHRIVVVRARDRPALDGFGVRHVHASARTGRRRMLVVEIEPPRRAGARTAVGGG